MILGYIRSSRHLENEDVQRSHLNEEQIDKFFIDVLNRTRDPKKNLKELIDYAREGDLVVIYDFSRVANSLDTLVYFIDTVRAKGANVKFIKEKLDTSNKAGMIKLKTFRDILEFQRYSVHEAKVEGIKLASRKGKYKGREPIQRPNNWSEVFAQYDQRNITGITAMKALGLKKNTFYRMVKEQREIDAQNVIDG